MNIELADVWRAAGVLIGFQVTAFLWRVSREVKVGQQNDLTWLPPADILNFISLVVTMVGVFTLPILGLAGLNLVKLSFGLAVLLLVGYPFALAGHYDMYTISKRIPKYFTRQEQVVVAIIALAVIAYLIFAIV